MSSQHKATATRTANYHVWTRRPGTSNPEIALEVQAHNATGPRLYDVLTPDEALQLGTALTVAALEAEDRPSNVVPIHGRVLPVVNAVDTAALARLEEWAHASDPLDRALGESRR